VTAVPVPPPEIDAELVAGRAEIAEPVADDAAPGLSPWAQYREARRKRRKKKIIDRVPNKNLDRDMARGTYARPIAKHPQNAVELTAVQVYRIFEDRIHFGHPADLCYSMYRLQPTEDDIEQIEFVCWLNVRQWMTSLRMCVYAGLPDTEWRQAETAPIAEDNLMDFLRVFRAKFAAMDPVRGRFFELCGTPGVTIRTPELIEAKKAVAALELAERRARLTRLGMRPDWIDEQMAFTDRMNERNRRGSCGGSE